MPTFKKFSPRELLRHVNAKVGQFTQKWGKRLPGLTVALNKDGELVLAEGYGTSNSKTGSPMTARTSCPIGSVTKAVVTGPSGWQLIHEQKPPIPPDRKLYGPDGLFKGDYDKDALIGVKRHTPIIDVAISPTDQVYAWYINGTVSSGYSNNLAAHSPPKPFTVPKGKSVADICGIGIANDNSVWVWYSDGTCSIGTPTKLDTHGWKTKEVDGKEERTVRKAALAIDGTPQPMAAIVGIDIAKSNNHVYVWYEDGSVSEGTSTDFGYHSPSCKEFTYAKVAGGSPLEIRGVGIASDNKVFAWFGNGKASRGMSTVLNKYDEPYTYDIPTFPSGEIDDWWDWYRAITLQHLLDHKAGFSRDGDVPKAAKMFGVADVSKVTYEQIHRHFLRTNKLISQPGKEYHYSNHGMGLWTLIIERIAKKSFRAYARDNYLKPLGLDTIIAPRTDPPNHATSEEHEVVDGVAVPKEFTPAEAGLAAGGYRASARGLAEAMLKLSAKYKHNDQTIDKMGWRNDDGRLFHNGTTDGGLSTVSMYPAGHEVDGVNLSRVHVAVVVNVSNTTHPETNESLEGDLIELAKALAALVHGATEPLNCEELQKMIGELSAELADLKTELADLEDFQDPNGPEVKPPKGIQGLRDKIAKVKKDIAAAKAQASAQGCT